MWYVLPLVLGHGVFIVQETSYALGIQFYSSRRVKLAAGSAPGAHVIETGVLLRVAPRGLENQT